MSPTNEFLFCVVFLSMCSTTLWVSSDAKANKGSLAAKTLDKRKKVSVQNPIQFETNTIALHHKYTTENRSRVFSEASDNFRTQGSQMLEFRKTFDPMRSFQSN
jgi:hypothetical protein